MNNMVLKNLQEDVAAIAAALAVADGNVDDIETALAVVDGNVDDIETALGTATYYLLASGNFNYADGRNNVLPSGANEKQVVGGGGAWVNGIYTEIAADLGAKPALITGIYVTAVSAGIHQIDLANGAAASEVVFASIPVSIPGYYPIIPTRILEGTRLAARTRSKAGGAQTADLFVTLRYLP